MAEPELLPDHLQLGELLGRDEALHREVGQAGAEVLAQGEDVHVDRAQVAHGLHHLVQALTHAEHHPALGAQAGVDLLGPAEDPQGALVAGLGAYLALQALHRLQVVIEDLRPGLDDRPQAIVRAL